MRSGGPSLKVEPVPLARDPCRAGTGPSPKGLDHVAPHDVIGGAVHGEVVLPIVDAPESLVVFARFALVRAAATIRMLPSDRTRNPRSSGRSIRSSNVPIGALFATMVTGLLKTARSFQADRAVAITRPRPPSPRPFVASEIALRTSPSGVFSGNFTGTTWWSNSQACASATLTVAYPSQSSHGPSMRTKPSWT